ncbi:MAG: metallophosphoesterase [Candidatus Ranarchaeia archaeon]
MDMKIGCVSPSLTGDKQTSLQMILNQPALLLNDPVADTRALIISDLHLGYGLSLREFGISIPSQYKIMFNRILKLIVSTNVDTLYIVGDLKHTTPKISSGEWFEVPNLLETLSNNVKVHIVKGNHDGDIEALCPSSVRVHPATGLRLKNNNGDILLLHGHAWPKIDDLDVKTIVTAHIHPVIKFEEKIKKRPRKLPVWIHGRLAPSKIIAFIPCKKRERERLVVASLKAADNTGEQIMQGQGSINVFPANVIVIPAFNRLLAGYPVNTAEKPLQGIWGAPGLLPLDKTELYLLDGTFMGTLAGIRAISNDPGHED